MLLQNQFTTFNVAYKMLIQYVAESAITTDVLWNWYTYYGQVFKGMKNTCELVSSLQYYRPVSSEAMA